VPEARLRLLIPIICFICHVGGNQKEGRIVGLVPNLVEGGLTHVHYADDTVLIIQNREGSIMNLKLILYWFERKSGIKINYHKSEVYVVGGDQKVKEEIAGKLNCKLGQFPMIYLGIPIHTKKLRQTDFVMVTEKVVKRTDPWERKLISSSGRLILVNSCLCSIPVYMMRFYHLIDGQHKEMDSIRGEILLPGWREEI
jgi:hypothetical protein